MTRLDGISITACLVARGHAVMVVRPNGDMQCFAQGHAVALSCHRLRHLPLPVTGAAATPSGHVLILSAPLGGLGCTLTAYD